MISTEVIGLAKQTTKRVSDDIGRRVRRLPMQPCIKLFRRGDRAGHSRRHFLPSARISASAESGPGVPATYGSLAAIALAYNPGLVGTLPPSLRSAGKLLAFALPVPGGNPLAFLSSLIAFQACPGLRIAGLGFRV